MVDFLLALIELFSLALFERGWVTLSANFMGGGGRPPTNFGVRKLESLGYHVVLFARSTFSPFDTILACDGQTDRHTDGHAIMAITRAELAPRG